MTSSNGSAQAAIDSLIADFNDDARLPEALYSIARTYEWLSEYEEANNIYQIIVTDYAGTAFALKAQLDIPKLNILSLIESGNDLAAQVAIDNLIADFNDHPYLPRVVFVIGEQYYNEAFRCEKEGLDAEAKENFTKAAAVWERIITQLPESDPATTAQAYCFSGHCYRKLGEYEKSTAYYQYVVADYPEHRTAWQALFRIAHNYEDMKDLGIISKTEAGPVIKAAYEQLLEKYPDCKMARVAQRWLSRHNSK